MVNLQNLNEGIDGDFDEITENEVITLFVDHGADDWDDYLYNTPNVTCKTALNWLGY